MDTVKTVVRRKFIALNAFLEEYRFKLNDLSYYLKELENEEKIILKVENKKEQRVEATEVANREIIVEINKARSWFLEKFNKIDNPSIKK